MLRTQHEHQTDVEHSEEDTQLLTILLDLNPYEWGRRRLLSEQHQQRHAGGHRGSHTQRPLLTLRQCVNQVLAFIHSYLISSHSNQVAVIGTHCGTRFRSHHRTHTYVHDHH